MTRRRERDVQRQMFHVLEHVIVGCRTSSNVAEELLGAVRPTKMCKNGQPAAIEPIARTRERNQHHQRAFVGRLVVMRWSCGSPWKVLKISRQE